mgnify:CR=1 FL=1
MAAEANLIKKADLARAREIDFVYRFNDSIKKLVEALGITRKIPKVAGTNLKAYKAVGTLEDGIVAEGDIIPLSKYETVPVTFAEITFKKWRKATSAEAIVEKGYDQAVNMTTTQMLKDVQATIKKSFFDFLAEGTGRAMGSTFQATLAQIWGQLQVKYEDTEFEAVYFMNPLDAADYLSTASITLQTAFGMNYIENFLGLGTVIFNSMVPRGTIYGTAKENIILYYIPVNGADLGEVFNFTSDQLGYIGIHELPEYQRMTAEDVVVSGIVLFAERIDGLIVGLIDSTDISDVTVAPEAQATEFWGVPASSLQANDISVANGAITGTVKYLSGSNAITDVWGEGNFLGLKFTGLDPKATSVKVGLVPSAGSGLVEIINDPDKNGIFKITSKDQILRVVSTDGLHQNVQDYSLASLTLTPAGA